MKIFSNFIKSLGFTFSLRRLRKSILLILLFCLIGLGVYFFYEIESSESWLKMIYTKEVSQKVDLQGNTVIKIYKKDITKDNVQDYVCIMANEERSSSNTLNSVIELYKDVKLLILDGNTNQSIEYSTQKDFQPEIDFNICEDKDNTYFIISDLSGNVSLTKLQEDNNVIDILKNTTDKEFLGYTMYINKSEENSNVINVNIDNYSKDYLGEFKEVKTLDFNEIGKDINKYRDTYLRDRFSQVNLEDIDDDGILEFIGCQYILYNLDDTQKEDKTLGKVKTIFKIEEDKLKYQNVNIEY